MATIPTALQPQEVQAGAEREAMSSATPRGLGEHRGRDPRVAAVHSQIDGAAAAVVAPHRPVSVLLHCMAQVRVVMDCSLRFPASRQTMGVAVEAGAVDGGLMVRRAEQEAVDKAGWRLERNSVLSGTKGPTGPQTQVVVAAAADARPTTLTF